MSYLSDPVFQTVEWLRGRAGESETIGNALAVAWRDWTGMACQDVELHLGFTNYKPFERARIVADSRLSLGNGTADAKRFKLLLHVFAEPEAAEAEFSQSTREPLPDCHAPPSLCLPSRGLVVWVLPNAPNLRELYHLMKPKGIQSLLPETAEATGSAHPEAPTLHRYVPYHRALLTWNGYAGGERLYIKIIACSMKAAAAALNLRELHARGEQGDFSFAVPRLVRYSPDLHTLIMTEVPGRPFTEVIGELRPLAFKQLGVALGELHRMPALPTDTWSLDVELADLKRHMAGAKRALPDLGKRLEAVLEGLEQWAGTLPAVPFTPIHGNLFGGQILYDDGSDKPIGFVDWDSWCYGDPHFDLGRLIAHVLYVAEIQYLPNRAVNDCIDALIAGYARAAKQAIHRPRLAWHVATALLLRAKISSLRQLAQGWPDHLDFVVSEAEAYLRDQGTAPVLRGIETGALAESMA